MFSNPVAWCAHRCRASWIPAVIALAALGSPRAWSARFRRPRSPRRARARGGTDSSAGGDRRGPLVAGLGRIPRRTKGSSRASATPGVDARPAPRVAPPPSSAWVAWARTTATTTRISTTRRRPTTGTFPDLPPATSHQLALGVVLTHVSADCDTLSSAVGLAKLRNHRLGANCTFVVSRAARPPGVVHYVQLHKNKFYPREARVSRGQAELGGRGRRAAARASRRTARPGWTSRRRWWCWTTTWRTSDIDATELIVESRAHRHGGGGDAREGKRAHLRGGRDAARFGDPRRHRLADVRGHHAEGREGAGVLLEKGASQKCSPSTATPR